jgi:hypothetical protein
LFDEARLDVVDGALDSDWYAWKIKNYPQAPDKFDDMLHAQDQAPFAAYYKYATGNLKANEVDFILKIDIYKGEADWDKARSIAAVFLNPKSKLYVNLPGEIEEYIRECCKGKRTPFKDKEHRDQDS